MTQTFIAENPWSNPGGNRPQNDGSSSPDPRSQRPGSNPPSWEKLRQQRSGGGSNLPPFWSNWQKRWGHDGAIAILIVIVLAVLWIGSGIYRVQPEEQAIITRFGRYTGTVEKQGLNYHWPWPIEDAQKVNVTFERRLEIGFMGAAGARMDNPDESQMLTGDANIVDLDFVIQWKVGDARDFVFNIREPENTIKKVGESAMREVVGQNYLQDIITDRREDVAVNVRKTMQSILDSYKSGVSITQVLIQDASVPQPVLDAFEDVIRATQEAETKKNQAYKYRNEIVPRAQGEAIRLTKEAEAYQQQVVSRANGEAKRFTNIYSAYKQSPGVTRERLYIDAIQDVLTNSDKMIIDNNGTGTLPYLNLNELRKAAGSNNHSTDTSREQ
ncbi:MAG TPA: FtsH protease activity modulator HflK [Alphaproteobacteria bacterium]